MKFDLVESLEAEGFKGFKKVGDLFEDCSDVPKEKGVYLVLFLGRNRPDFRKESVGGYFKGKNPNKESIADLCSEWVDGTIVIYIGQAGGRGSRRTLRDRISTYMKFGKGQRVAHWGGRYIWRIEPYKDLTICWKTTLEDPEDVERAIIKEFKGIYKGKRPFANLRD